MRTSNCWTVGPWTFYEAVDHGFSGPIADKPVYGFTVTAEEKTDDRGVPRVGEWYGSLDHAMVAAVGEKHTGRRGAGGTGVGTAADWFMAMIGAGQLQEAGADGGRALAEALDHSDGFPPVSSAGMANRVETLLGSKGIVLAREAR